MDGYWKVYFELNGKSLDDAVQFIKETFAVKSLWYHHPYGKQGKGAHIHGLVYGYTQTAETVRNKIKKRFSLVKQGSFGISNTYEKGTKMSEETVPGYISYMSKGQYDPVCNIGYENEYLNERKREWKEPTTVHISGDLTVIAKTVSGKKTQYQLAREASALYLESCESRKEEIKYLEGTFSKNRMIKIVIGLCRDNHIAANYRTVANICQDAMSELVPDYYVSKIISML